MTTSARATCPTTTARKTRTTTRAPFLYILLTWSRGRSSSPSCGRGDGAGVGGDGAPRDDGAIVKIPVRLGRRQASDGRADGSRATAIISTFWAAVGRDARAVGQQRKRRHERERPARAVRFSLIGVGSRRERHTAEKRTLGGRSDRGGRVWRRNTAHAAGRAAGPGLVDTRSRALRFRHRVARLWKGSPRDSMQGGYWRPSASPSTACRRKRSGARRASFTAGEDASRTARSQLYGDDAFGDVRGISKPAKTRELLVPRRITHKAGRERHLAVPRTSK